MRNGTRKSARSSNKKKDARKTVLSAATCRDDWPSCSRCTSTGRSFSCLTLLSAIQPLLLRPRSPLDSFQRSLLGHVVRHCLSAAGYEWPEKGERRRGGGEGKGKEEEEEIKNREQTVRISVNVGKKCEKEIVVHGDSGHACLCNRLLCESCDRSSGLRAVAAVPSFLCCCFVQRQDER